MAANKFDVKFSELAALRALVERLQERVAVLEASQPGRARDREDLALRVTLAGSTQGLPFTSSQLLAHAAVDPALREALAAASLQGPRELGAWLRDAAGTREGITIERLRRRRWRAYMSST